jgi:tetratricopeptide (TPR) repeat protein
MPSDAIEQMLNVAIRNFRLGKLGDAEDGFRLVLTLEPGRPDALHYLGVIAYRVGRHDLAIEMIGQSIKGNPRNAEAHSNLGAALRAAGRLDESAAACRTAIELDPNLASAHTHLANLLRRQGNLDEALAAYQRAVAIDPHNARYLTNLGGGLGDIGQLDQAIAAYRRAIELQPDMAEAHWNMALVMLLKGDAGGWKEYEWRWKSPRFTSPHRNFTRPQWTGQPLDSRTILLHAEQGFGDAIQFVRFAPMVASRGGTVILEIQPHLRRLFETAPGIHRLIATGDTLPHFDVHCPLASLPLALGLATDPIPGDVPYLRADPLLVEQWRQRFDRSSHNPRVGLAWAGSPRFEADYSRSIALSQLAPLAAVTGVDFYSLQLGDAAAQAEAPIPGMTLIQLGADLHDFADTAAAISAMDLVITTDTSIPHLAGAIGKPVWLMLQFMPDWRWLLHREDSPWYPSMRLFRQPAPGDWDSVIKNVAESLAQYAANSPRAMTAIEG